MKRISCWIALIAIQAFADPIRPILTCPKDYKQTGKVCLKVEYADFQYSCPKGSQLDEAGNKDGLPSCVAFEAVPAAMACPDGFHPGRDKKCERINRFPARAECEDRFSFTNGQCIRNVVYETNLICPKGHKLEGNQCLLRSKHQLIPSCPPGTEMAYEKEKAFCRRAEIMSPQVLCPTGYTRPRELTGNIIDIARIADGGVECVRTDVQPVEMSCQKGYKLESGLCSRSVDTGKPELICEVGSLNGKKCELIESMAAVLVCKKGYQLEEGRCIKVQEQPPEMVCDKGWKISDHVGQPRCERVTQTESEYRCPEGSSLQNKKCVAAESIPLVASCKKGFEEHGGQCVRRHTRHPEVICPENFELAHDKCLLVTVTQPEQTCPANTSRKGKHCESVATTPPKPTCKKGHLEGEQCVETMITAPRAFCPKNYTLDKDQCLAFDYVKPDKVCATGVPRGEKCEIPIRVEPLQRCPKGFVVGVSGRCQRAHATDAKHSCPGHTKLANGICVERGSLR